MACNILQVGGLTRSQHTPAFTLLKRKEEGIYAAWKERITLVGGRTNSTISPLNT